MVLRRPISICSCDRKNNLITLAYEVKGKGTALLSKMKANDILDFIGPLGKGFTLSDEYSRIIAVGGGIGIFPLLFLLEEYAALYPEIKRSACLGFRSKCSVVMEKEFLKALNDHDDLHITTDDGTYCTKGYVTCSFDNLLKDNIKQGGGVLVCACGPLIMLKNVADMADKEGARCEVSLEERMGCGIGACLVCACAIRSTDETQVYRHVCSDGPVFNAKDVIFD
jgi:dihydroorotate dehydrogenase electron transfer subunit